MELTRRWLAVELLGVVYTLLNVGDFMANLAIAAQFYWPVVGCICALFVTHVRAVRDLRAEGVHRDALVAAASATVFVVYKTGVAFDADMLPNLPQLLVLTTSVTLLLRSGPTVERASKGGTEQADAEYDGDVESLSDTSEEEEEEEGGDGAGRPSPPRRRYSLRTRTGSGAVIDSPARARMAVSPVQQLRRRSHARALRQREERRAAEAAAEAAAHAALAVDTGVSSGGEETVPRAMSRSRRALARVRGAMSLSRSEEAVAKFFRQPHTLTGLVVAVGFMVYAAFWVEPGTAEENAQRGALAVCAMFLLFLAIKPHDTLLMRPHPVIWRVTTGIHFIYLCSITWLLFQTTNDARRSMTFLHPDLNRKIEYRDYADSCALYTPDDPESNFRNLRDTLNDEFVMAHLIGWWGKAMMIRDVKLSLIMSGMFEMMEITFSHMLPNFNECWWDQLLVDFLGCNLIGMVVGIYTCKYFAIKTYNWVGIDKIKTQRGRLKRAAAQFTPYSWTPYKWEALSSPKRFVAIFMIVVVMLAVEVNAFFLKYVLHVPPRNPVNPARLTIWFLTGVAAMAEFYEYMSNKQCKRVGTNVWLALCTASVEVLVCIKFGEGMFPQPVPGPVFWVWTLCGVSLAVWYVWFFFLRRAGSAEEESDASGGSELAIVASESESDSESDDDE